MLDICSRITHTIACNVVLNIVECIQHWEHKQLYLKFLIFIITHMYQIKVFRSHKNEQRKSLKIQCVTRNFQIQLFKYVFLKMKEVF